MSEAAKNYAGIAVIPALGMDRFKRAEFMEPVHHALVPEGCTADDLKRPEFWAHVSRIMGFGHLVHAMAEDRSFYAQGIVLDAGATWAKIDWFMVRELGAATNLDAEDEDYVVRFIPTKGFRVVRKSDRAVIKDGLADRGAALIYIKEHRKALAA
jgi:hypothetical protein